MWNIVLKVLSILVPASHESHTICIDFLHRALSRSRTQSEVYDLKQVDKQTLVELLVHSRESGEQSAERSREFHTG
jgi:hypothetical protein